MTASASLSRRLLTAAGAFIAVAMIVATVLISFVLHRFITGQIDFRLDGQIAFLASVLRAGPDGDISMQTTADGPPFDRVRQGWYWQVVGPRNAIASASLDGARLDQASAVQEERTRPPRKGPKKDEGRPRPADGLGPNDERLHYRIKQVEIGAQSVTIIASAPRAAVLGPLWEALTTVGIAFAILALALIAAMVLQVRLGLRPLARLRESLAGVRSGQLDRIPSEQPAEVHPLVAEMNALLDQNAAGLERARRHVANLAHGLKTPLATLSVMAASGARDPVALQALSAQMERRIRHHLARARVAALAGPVRPRTAIRSRIGDLCETMKKIYRARGVAAVIDIPDDVFVACEPQDFDEIAGNLIDNAFKWASHQVSVRASVATGQIAIAIEDDGPGLSAEQQSVVLQPGKRLDETTLGFGFGLSIANELAELYGGSVSLNKAEAGGLRVIAMLPAA